LSLCRGEDQLGKVAFREWYGQLGELRSLVPDARFLLLTATASTNVRKEIQKKFGCTDMTEIIESPDRENIKLCIMRYNSSMKDCDVFYSVISGISAKKDQFNRILIFCRSISDCGKLFVMFSTNLPSSVMSNIHMFHSQTLQHVKDYICSDMQNENGKIRILICTSVAGMGVNFAGVNTVIHYGPPKNVDDLLQQIGRAGRSGAQAYNILLYCPRHRKGLSDEVVSYISCTECYRFQLMSYYGGQKCVVDKHLCCSYCALNCDCASDICNSNKSHPWFTLHDGSESDDSESSSVESDTDFIDNELDELNIFDTDLL
jgi:superfamily II DNA helicase RecQ